MNTRTFSIEVEIDTDTHTPTQIRELLKEQIESDNGSTYSANVVDIKELIDEPVKMTGKEGTNWLHKEIK